MKCMTWKIWIVDQMRRTYKMERRKSNTKDAKIIMYITQNEKAMIESQAVQNKRSTSDYCRMTIMEQVKRAKVGR